MPRYYKSTERRPGRGIRKSYRHGGRNLRDEEARVIGVQDNAADELRRVRGRRPKDAREVRDRRAQLARVGSRERNARDEMRRLRGYQRGGGIDSLPRPLTGLSSMMRMPPGLQGQPWPGGEPPPNQSGVAYPRPRMGTLPNPAQGQRLMPGPGVFPATGRIGPESFSGRLGPAYGGLPAPAPSQGLRQWEVPQSGVAPRTLQPLPLIGPQQFRPPRPSIDQQTLARMAAAQRPRGGFNAPPSLVGQPQGRGIAPVQRGSSPKPWFSSTQRPEYLPETQAQFVPWARGGRVGLKTGGRIPRKKGVKFV